MTAARTHGTAILVMVWSLALALVWPAPASAVDQRNGRIAFSRDGDVFTVRPDGTGLRQVTDGPRSDTAVWSPHGRHLAVAQCPCGNPAYRPRVLVVRPDGTQRVRITRRVVSYVQGLAWSPDGRAVAYADYDIDNPDLPAPYASAIKVARADGTADVRITGYGSWNFAPAWSPDGRWLAFNSYRDGDSEIFLMRPDGNRLRQLTHNDVDDIEPMWSPDGSRIAFTSTRSSHDGFSQWVSVVRADGTDPRELTPTTGQHQVRGWSPDGRSLLAERSVMAPEAMPVVTIVVLDADGSTAREVVTGEALWAAAWSPDGRQILYSRDQHIYTIAAGGGQPVRITRGYSPSWQPVPTR